ncbi:MotE family protein [Elioraea thermophila]|uniref:MotE family protein n=1 Tax=Elioraea thermophila TaxID=2185104 RepID=UPI0013004A42|nr:hypothetical protein [Elioraea thermophila]
MTETKRMNAANTRLGIRLRVLPFVIVTAASLLAVRVIGLAVRAPAPDAATPAVASLPMVPVAQAARAQAPSAPPQPTTGGTAQPPAESPAQREGVREGASLGELAVLEDLRRRRLALEERERALAEREALVIAAERRLAARIEEIAALQRSLEAQDRAAREREEAGWRGLVRIYEQMRPRDAARIFNELEMGVLIEVVSRMRERLAAPILAGMEPEKAKALTAELAQRRTRPGGEAASGG